MKFFSMVVLGVLSLAGSSFAFETQSRALNLILDRAKQLVSEHKIPVMISDLDETVIDSLPRRYKQHQAAANVFCKEKAQERSVEELALCERVLGVSQKDFYLLKNGYSTPELFERIGIDPDSEFVKGFKEVRKKFYPLYVDQDGSMPGAITYFRELKKIGAELFYVSARSVGIEDSYLSVIKLGFIDSNERNHVFLNTDKLKTIEFKEKTVELIKKQLPSNAEVIGLFENESDNLAKWKESFPKAKMIFVRGNSSQEGPNRPTFKMSAINDYR